MIQDDILKVGRLLGHTEMNVRRMLAKSTDHKLLYRKLKDRHRSESKRISDGIDRSAVDAMAVENAERYARHRQQAADDLERHRQARSLGQRLDQALLELEAASSLSASRLDLAKTSHAKPDSTPPPMVDEEARLWKRRARMLVTALETELDRTVRRDPSDIRLGLDDRLRTYEGFSPEEISFYDPSMGRPAAVANARRGLGLRVRDGKQRSDIDRLLEDRRAVARGLRVEGFSFRKIAEMVGCSHTEVQRMCVELVA